MPCSNSSSPRTVREGPSRVSMYPRLAAGFGEFAHPQNIALPLGHRDDAARVEQIESVACLDALVVGRQRHQVLFAVSAILPAGREIFLASGFRHLELLEQHLDVGMLEIMSRIFLLGLQEHLAIRHLLGAMAAVEIQVIDAIDAL